MDSLNIKHPFQKILFFILLSGVCYIFFDQLLASSINEASLPLLKGFSLLIFPPLHLTVWSLAFIIARLKKHGTMVPLFEIAMSQCLAVAFTRIFKVLFGRARPNIFLENGTYGFHGLEWNHEYHSFPSGHTITAFTLATSASFIFPKYRVAFYCLATLFSLSRPLLLDHYLSDVIGTAAIGIIIGYFVHIMTRRIHYETV